MLSGSLVSVPLGQIHVVVCAQVLDEVILAREAIAPLARAMINGAVAENRVVHAGLVALEVGAAREPFPAVVASERLSRPERRC